MEKTREFLQSIGLPGGDAYNLPTSEKRFKDGGQYRFEVPGIQGPKVMKALLEANPQAENMTDDQVSEMKAAKEKLMESAQKVFAKMYENAQAAQGAGGAGGAGPDMSNMNMGGGAQDAGANAGGGNGGDDVVDADYKEV